MAFSLLFFVDIFRRNLAEREPENIIATTNVRTMRKIIGTIEKSITPPYPLEHSPTTVLKGCWIGKINKLSQPHPMIIIQSITSLDRTRVVKVKSICKQHIDRHIQNVEALFLNIDWGKKGQTINDFRNIKLDSFKLMEKGLVFIWAPKQLIFEILQIMQEKSFFYVENL